MGQSGKTEGPARAHPTEPGAPSGDARRLRPQLAPASPAHWVRASGRLAHWTGGLQAWQQRRRRSAGAGGAAREKCRPTRPNTRPAGGDSRVMGFRKGERSHRWQGPQKVTAARGSTKQKQQPCGLKVGQRADALKERVLLGACGLQLGSSICRMATRNPKCCCSGGKAGSPTHTGASVKLTDAWRLEPRGVPSPCFASRS